MIQMCVQVLCEVLQLVGEVLKATAEDPEDLEITMSSLRLPPASMHVQAAVCNTLTPWGRSALLSSVRIICTRIIAGCAEAP
jgi:hypothetical protein